MDALVALLSALMWVLVVTGVIDQYYVGENGSNDDTALRILFQRIVRKEREQWLRYFGTWAISSSKQCFSVGTLSGSRKTRKMPVTFMLLSSHEAKSDAADDVLVSDLRV